MAEVRRPHVAQAILAYLADHPDAQDTLAGIAKWWLLEQQIKTETAAVKEAIAQLIAAELIVERKGRDSQVHYRINVRKLREIEAILQQKAV